MRLAAQERAEWFRLLQLPLADAEAVLSHRRGPCSKQESRCGACSDIAHSP